MLVGDHRAVGKEDPSLPAKLQIDPRKVGGYPALGIVLEKYLEVRDLGVRGVETLFVYKLIIFTPELGLKKVCFIGT